MAQEKLPEAADVLNMLSQPVWFVRHEQVVGCNDAAALALDPARPGAADWMAPEDLAAYRAWDGQQPLLLTVLLGGAACEALVRREADTDVFAARPRPDGESLRLQALTAVGRALRADLTGLFDAASELFPRLEELEDPRIQRQTARISQGLYRLLRLAGNLTETGGCLTGETRALFQKTELKAFFEGLYGDLAPLFAMSGAELALSGLTAPLWAAVDRQKLGRAVRNLLANALRAAPGGRVELRVEEGGHAVYVRVSDNGEGMTPSRMATAFDGYETAAGRESGWGAGLGLPLVRHIAALHGGTVVLNAKPGEGTTVTLSLSTRLEPSPAEEVRNPVRSCDYTGGYSVDLLEFADALPPEAFDSRNLF